MSPQPFGTWPGSARHFLPSTCRAANDYVYKKIPKARDLAIAHRRASLTQEGADLAHQEQGDERGCR